MVMSTRTTLLLAIFAGFFGGIISRRIALTPVFAQTLTPATKEIRAERFVVVDENGLPRGAFGIDTKSGWPIIEFTDSKGHVRRLRYEVEGPGLSAKGKSSVVPER